VDYRQLNAITAKG
jgi:hypothetical protein